MNIKKLHEQRKPENATRKRLLRQFFYTVDVAGLHNLKKNITFATAFFEWGSQEALPVFQATHLTNVILISFLICTQ